VQHGDSVDETVSDPVPLPPRLDNVNPPAKLGGPRKMIHPAEMASLRRSGATNRTLHPAEMAAMRRGSVGHMDRGSLDSTRFPGQPWQAVLHDGTLDPDREATLTPWDAASGASSHRTTLPTSQLLSAAASSATSSGPITLPPCSVQQDEQPVPVSEAVPLEAQSSSHEQETTDRAPQRLGEDMAQAFHCPPEPSSTACPTMPGGNEGDEDSARQLQNKEPVMDSQGGQPPDLRTVLRHPGLPVALPPFPPRAPPHGPQARFTAPPRTPMLPPMRWATPPTTPGGARTVANESTMGPWSPCESGATPMPLDWSQAHDFGATPMASQVHGGTP